MIRWLSALLLGCVLCTGELPLQEEEMVNPDSPVVTERAPSDKVTNGTVYESGRLELPEKHELVLPNMAVVEEYDGKSVRFFVTKSMHCVGHPPNEMRIGDARANFGIAHQEEGNVHRIGTYGEWANRGGSAQIQMLVLVPRGQSFRLSADLEGESSEANTKMDFDNPAMKKCYWYAGTAPKEGWKPVLLEINYNRFVAPK